MAKKFSNGELSERSKSGLVQVEDGYFDLMFTIGVIFKLWTRMKYNKNDIVFKSFITKVFEADVLILTLG